MDRDERIRVPIRDSSGIAWAVMEARNTAQSAGFGNQACQMVVTVVSELAYNIIKYAGSGEILLRQARANGRTGIEVTAKDRGPGIDDIEQAMADHFSSSGTLGLGLPGVKRMMDEFAIRSKPGQGTTVVAVKWR